ncbi:hypothetical protein ACFV2N_48015 [Streptomyces sp. NPDC059680]|uniref:lytic transglycosylase domain-containing protein n=1 Tax=Streptomyces sp. NPDC059680 TaxID=3346904 RepID=UPI00369F37D8
MSDISPSSDERQESHAAREHSRRSRRIIMIGAAVACTAGAVTTSLSSISPPKTSAAYPFAIGAQQDVPAAPAPPAAPVAPPKTPLPPLQKHSDDKAGEKKTPGVEVVSAAPPVDVTQTGIPTLPLMAYRRAAYEQAIRTPGCHLPWTLLAAIGKIESNHARNGALTDEGFTASPILGPVLNGRPFAALHDSDQGKFDGNTTWDRAVGPMQFIPSTWKRWGITTRPTHVADPNNIFDASTSAAAYLCANNRDLNDPLQLNQAILSYNPSQKYLHDVLALNSAYVSGQPAVTDAAAMPAVAHGPSDQSSSEGSPATTHVSPATAVNAALHQNSVQKISSPSESTTSAKSTPQKAEQRPATGVVEQEPTPGQQPQVSASLSVPTASPVQAPAPAPEPALPRPALMEASFRTQSAPSPSTTTAPRLERVVVFSLLQGAHSNLPVSLEDVLPTGAVRS